MNSRTVALSCTENSQVNSTAREETIGARRKTINHRNIRFENQCPAAPFLTG